MEEQQNNRTKWLHVRLTEDEQKKIKKAFAATTQTKLSDYTRDILLGKPMIGAVRNQSLQEILQVLVLLRKDINGIGNNFNQAVHKLHTLRHVPQFQVWYVTLHADKQRLLDDISAIKSYIDQTAEQWLRS